MLYNMLDASEVLNKEGLAYFNPYSFNRNTFNPKKTISEYALTSRDIRRFDIFIYNTYGTTYYESFILLINNIIDIHAVKVGTVIRLYEASDMDEFFQLNSIKG